SRPPGNGPMRHLIEHWGVKLVPLKDEESGKNLMAKAKIILMEQLDGNQLGLGIHQLAGNLGHFFTSQGIHSIMKKNQFLINKKKIRLSILAEPEIILQEKKEAIISVGAEIPYNSISWQQGGEVKNTHWKFAGLKVSFLLKKLNSRYELKYKTQFTRPSDGGIVGGNKESSVVSVKLNKPFKLFQIGLQTKNKQTSGMPWISNVPLLGSIFQSTSGNFNYKKIIGIIILKEYED
ncbi:MAG: hypothetical protein OXB84_01770, partial [Halobacteriovoraceae bacterium]|nr:hypothetical protein [Halobacteriovoraceae bacterium]